MVEMLGVLAIMGVLSIGGIMGYSYAMDKHRANQTLQIDINQATAENKTDCASGDNEITFYFPINTTGTGDYSDVVLSSKNMN